MRTNSLTKKKLPLKVGEKRRPEAKEQRLESEKKGQANRLVAVLVHGLQGFCSIIFLLTGHALLNPGRSVHLVPLIHLVAGLFLKFIPVDSLLCVLLRIPNKANSSQIVPQINNVLIQGVKGVHYLFGDYLVDRIHPLDLLLKLGESVILMVSGVLTSIFLLATHLVISSSGFLVLVSTLVFGLVVPIL